MSIFKSQELITNKNNNNNKVNKSNYQFKFMRIMNDNEFYVL